RAGVLRDRGDDVTGDRRLGVDRAQEVGGRVPHARRLLVAESAEVAAESAWLAPVTFHGSTSLPLRTALLGERRHPFGLILTGEQGEERPPFVAQPRRQRQFVGQLDGLLGRQHGDRRLRRDRRREGERL